MYSLLF